MAPAAQTNGLDELVYLEYHDGRNNSHKFYQLARLGSQVSYQWGRVGTKGQSQVKDHGNPSRASTALHDKLSIKESEGYGRTTRPSDAPEVPFTTNTTAQAIPAAPEEEDYFLEWSVSESQALDESALEKAYATAKSVLDEAPELGLTVNYVGPHGVTGGHVQFIEQGRHMASFGFPPQSFLDGLTSRERKAVLELGTSRDGWLSANGKGQGIITTEKSKSDFAVRLFLSILATRHDVVISCSGEQEYGTRGLRVNPTDHEQFEWYPLWESVLKPSVVKHWFVEGDSTVVVLDEEGEEAATQYAW